MSENRRVMEPSCPRGGKHDWQPLTRSRAKERCAKCGTDFPCAHACKHIDCIVDTGRKLPDHITLVEADFGD